jgi:hypothetical protein
LNVFRSYPLRIDKKKLLRRNVFTTSMESYIFFRGSDQETEFFKELDISLKELANIYHPGRIH